MTACYCNPKSLGLVTWFFLLKYCQTKLEQSCLHSHNTVAWKIQGLSWLLILIFSDICRKWQLLLFSYWPRFSSGGLVRRTTQADFQFLNKTKASITRLGWSASFSMYSIRTLGGGSTGRHWRWWLLCHVNPPTLHLSWMIANHGSKKSHITVLKLKA